MKSISKSQLKPKLLEYFRQVELTGEELVVTDRGRPVVKIVPFERRLTIGEVQARLAGKGRNLGAALLPMDPEDYEFDGDGA